MRSILVLVLVAACGAKSAPPPPPTNTTPPPAEGSATTPPNEEGPICGTRGAAACPANMFCNFQPGADCGATDHPGHCMVAPTICAEIYRPVCGCDGKTHSNSCEAASAKTGVKTAGECPK